MSKENGLFLLVVGVFIAFNQAILSKWFIRKMGPYQTMRLGLFLNRRTYQHYLDR